MGFVTNFVEPKSLVYWTIKHHGRWSSDSAKDGYVKDSLSSRLSVSKALGV